MLPILAIVALVAIVHANPSSPRFPNGRIVGGEDAVIENYPYQIALEVSIFHACGGSIISKHYVLTAGHCVATYPDSYYKVRAGSSFRGRGGSVHQVEKVIRHEDYFASQYGIPINDIALLKVKEPFQFDDTRQPISLYNSGEESVPGVDAVVTGWGDLSSGGKVASQLQSVVAPIISKELCHEAYLATHGGIPEGQICAGVYGVGGKSFCQGDSGGALTIDGRVAGIVSWSRGCAGPYYPGVYTEVAYYRDWINKHAQE